MLLAEVYRENNEWQMKATGEGSKIGSRKKYSIQISRTIKNRTDK